MGVIQPLYVEATIYIRVSVLGRDSVTRHVDYSIPAKLDPSDDATLLDQCKQAMADHLSVARWLEGKTVLSATVLEAHYRDADGLYHEII